MALSEWALAVGFATGVILVVFLYYRAAKALQRLLDRSRER